VKRIIVLLAALAAASPAGEFVFGPIWPPF